MSKSLEKKLKEIQSIKKWGEKNLGFPKFNLFRFYDRNFKEIHIVYYCRMSRLPKNYWDMFSEEFDTEKEALTRKKELESKWYEVYYKTIEAKQGMQKISKSLLESNLHRKIYLIFHEYMHEHLNLIKYSDRLLSLEEACSDIAGYSGAVEYMAEKYGRGSKEYRKSVKEEKSNFEETKAIIKYYTQLNQLMNSKIPDNEKSRKKEKLLKELAKDPKIYNYEFEKPNLAKLADAMTYSRSYPLASEVHKKAGSTRKAIKVFKNLPSLLKGKNFKYGKITEKFCINYLKDYLL